MYTSIFPYFRVSFQKVEFFEHYGTHMDAPSHFGHGRQAMHEIPPERLIGPGVVINVKEKARINSNYEVTVEDLLKYEANYGRIPPNAIVLMNSGWSKYYPLSEVYLGTQDLTNVSTFNFPGFGMEACEFLLAKRQVSVVGVDTNSVDPGQPSPGHGFPYPCHFHLQPNNVPLLENVANLDSIPAKGTTIILGGIKTRSGTGGPTRVVAFVEDVDDDKIGDGSAGITLSPDLLLFILLMQLNKFIRI